MAFHRFTHRKGFFAAVAIFAVLVVLFIGYLFLCGQNYARVSLPQKYWLLVRECEDTTAAAIIGQSYVSGGAGYLLEANGKQTVALACYYSETAAQSVRRTMSGKGVETQIIVLAPSDIELNGNAVSHAQRIIANAETVDTCARILYDAANGLERAELSQEEARAAVRGVGASLKGLIGGNSDRLYSEWNADLERARKKSVEISEGILFAKDLRYLQVTLCVFVSNAAEYFA